MVGLSGLASLEGTILSELEVDEGAGQAGIWGNTFHTEQSASTTLEWETCLACWQQEFCVGGNKRKKEETGGLRATGA